MVNHKAIDIGEPATLEQASQIITELVDEVRRQEVEDWPEKELILFLKENGEVELWGPRGTRVRMVHVREEVERIDYCETGHGLDFTGLAMLAHGVARPLLTIESMSRWLSNCYSQIGETRPLLALAAAWRDVIKHLSFRRAPYILNVLRENDAVRQAEKIVDELANEEINAALYATTTASYNRNREDERTRLRRATGD